MTGEIASAGSPASSIAVERSAPRPDARARGAAMPAPDADRPLDGKVAPHRAAAPSLPEVEQSRAALDTARTNLRYTDILSPTDGVVISRAVNVGQTVAASLSAPVIFTIAQDLRKMEVHTNVAESDIGRLKKDMRVSFTVDAYPGEPAARAGQSPPRTRSPRSERGHGERLGRSASRRESASGYPRRDRPKTFSSS